MWRSQSAWAGRQTDRHLWSFSILHKDTVTWYACYIRVGSMGSRPELTPNTSQVTVGWPVQIRPVLVTMHWTHPHPHIQYVYSSGLALTLTMLCSATHTEWWLGHITVSIHSAEDSIMRTGWGCVKKQVMFTRVNIIHFYTLVILYCICKWFWVNIFSIW